MKRVVAPIDFHGASEAVVAFAGQLVLALELPLELLYVDKVIGMEAFESINREEHAAVEQQLRDIMTSSVPDKVTCAVRVESVPGKHNVAQGIIDASQGAALLVISGQP